MIRMPALTSASSQSVAVAGARGALGEIGARRVLAVHLGGESGTRQRPRRFGASPLGCRHRSDRKSGRVGLVGAEHVDLGEALEQLLELLLLDRLAAQQDL